MAKASIEIRSLARQHTEKALSALVKVMESESEPGSARVSAAVALLDRGWGKPAQTLVGDPDQPMEMVMRWATAAEATPDPSERS